MRMRPSRDLMPWLGTGIPIRTAGNDVTSASSVTPGLGNPAETKKALLRRCFKPSVFYRSTPGFPRALRAARHRNFGGTTTGTCEFGQAVNARIHRHVQGEIGISEKFFRSGRRRCGKSGAMSPQSAELQTENGRHRSAARSRGPSGRVTGRSLVPATAHLLAVMAAIVDRQRAVVVAVQALHQVGERPFGLGLGDLKVTVPVEALEAAHHAPV